MKKLLIIFAMITALTMAAWGDVPFNSAYASTATEEVAEEQPDAAEEEAVEEEEVIVEDDEAVIEDDEVTDQDDADSKPSE